MKNILLPLLLFLFCIAAVTAQTDRKGWMIGSTAGLDFTDHATSNSFNIGLSPQAGYFITDNLALGVSVPFNLIIDKTESIIKPSAVRTRTYTIGAGPFVRYYIGKSAIRPFLEAGANYRTTNSRESAGNFNETTKENSYSISAIAGLSYFISRHIGLETRLGYTYFNGESLNKYSTLGLTFGFQVYLPNKTD